MTPISISVCFLNFFISAKEYMFRVKILNCVEGHKVNVLLPIFKSRCVTIKFLYVIPEIVYAYTKKLWFFYTCSHSFSKVVTFFHLSENLGYFFGVKFNGCILIRLNKRNTFHMLLAIEHHSVLPDSWFTDLALP